MSAHVEQMMYHGALPWHGHGNPVADEDQTNIDVCIVKSGLDSEVGLRPLVTVNSAQSVVDYAYDESNHIYGQDAPAIKPDVSYNAVVRLTDNSILGVVGPRYKPLQNRDAFDWFQPFLDAGTCKLHTAGSLFNGQKIWILAELNKNPSVVAKGDEIKKFILLSNSHDGTTSVRVGYTPVRVVCANTLSMAHRNGSALIRLRHSSQLKTNLNAVRDIMDEANATFEATAEQYQYLAGRHVNVADLRKFVKIVLKVDKVDDNDLKTRTRNTISKIIGLCESGRGNNNPAVRNTWWTAYNGVTEYLNHTKGRTTAKRLDNIWFGNDVKTNSDALKTALEMAAC
jgi:phage/plasmid-like protein (TIGR03299 family)